VNSVVRNPSSGMAGTGTLVFVFYFRKELFHETTFRIDPASSILARGFGIAAVCLALAMPAFAQGNSPWENAVNVLQLAFTSTIARGFRL